MPAEPLDTVGVDNFKCYDVALARSGPELAPVLGVSVQDELSTTRYDVKKPVHLCVPVDKNGENPGAVNNAGSGSLMCYQAKIARGDPKYVNHSLAVANNNFPHTRLALTGVDELCVPAAVDPMIADF